MQNGPDPNNVFPLANYDRLCFLKNIITNPNIIVGGNPASEIRRRFSDDKIQKLLEMKWWDWPVEKITKHVQLLTGNEVAELYAIHQNNI